MAKENSKVRVLIADDHPIFREGLVQIIGKGGNLEVVAAAGNGRDAIEDAIRTKPHIVVLDVAMPEMDGIEAAKKLRAVLPGVEIIFLTMHKNRSILQAMAPLKVKGYVLKDSAMNEIVNCIEIVMSGRSYLSPSLSDLIIGSADGLAATSVQPILRDLTDAEVKVLRRISESKTTREIADYLNVSSRTIETHRHNICLKLGLTGPHALFKFAVLHKDDIAA